MLQYQRHGVMFMLSWVLSS